MSAVRAGGATVPPDSTDTQWHFAGIGRDHARWENIQLNSDGTIRLAQIGLGYWGRNLLRNFHELPGVALVRLCDRDATALAKLAAAYRGIATCRAAEEVFDDDTVDAVAIATPAASHYALAKQALLAGKHVFVEKPMARSISECEELIALAQQRDRVLMIGHTFLYNTAVRRIKEFLQQGAAGQVYYITARRLNFGIVRGDVDALWNFAPHDVAILLYWLETMPLTVRAHGYAYLQPDLVDVAFLHLLFPHGISAHLHVSWLDPDKVRQMTIVGSQKMIIYDDVHPDHKVQIVDKGITNATLHSHFGEFDSFGAFQLIHRAGDLLVPKIDQVEPLRVQCQHFVECVLNHQRPLTDGEHGLAVVRVLTAAAASLSQGGAQVNL